MAWYGWLSLGVSLTGWVMTWRRIAWLLIDDIGGANPGGDDLIFGLVLGALFALAWPVIVPFYVLYRLGHNSPALWRFVRPPSHIARERQLDQRERHIADLERELGVGR